MWKVYTEVVRNRSLRGPRLRAGLLAGLNFCGLERFS